MLEPCEELVNVNESIDLIKIYSNDNQGFTYQISDLKKYENATKKRRDKQSKLPEPVRPSGSFAESRMQTVVVYGWKPWENIIGKEGTKMADKIFREFVQDPLINVDKNDLKLLIPSLKIIMSSKLLGLDRYLEPASQHGFDDISYN